MSNNCKYRKGFTLIELMVVLFIVGILSAVAIPYMRGRTDAAKWSEGKAMGGTVRTAIRAYFAEKSSSYNAYATDLTGKFAVFSGALGFATGDLNGRYFTDADFEISNVQVSNGNLQYTITIKPATQTDRPLTPSLMTLNQDGTFTEIP
jgi:prepilin-type N-terminal cleavage/methylation domain-containing protein